MRSEAPVKWVPVRDVGDVRMGKQLSPASRDAAGQFPYLRVANVYEGRIDFSDVKTMGFSPVERELFSLRPGDILLNEGQENLRMVGRSAIYSGAPNAYCYQNTLIRFRPGPGVIPEYAQAVFVQWRAQGVFAGVAEKTSISHLGGNRFGRLLFPLRERSAQLRIVEVIDAVDNAISLSRRALGKESLVEEGLLRRSLEPSPDDEMEDWVNGRFIDLAHLQRGFDITVAEQRVGSVPVVSSSGVSSFHDVPKAKGPGVVTGRKGKLGDVYYLDSEYWPHDTSLWVTDFKGNDPYFVALYMRAMRLEQFDAATSVPTLNRNIVHRIPVIFPRLSRQIEIVERVKAQNVKVAAIGGEIAKLNAIKRGLVNDLLVDSS
ncbi:restriction endonuclease subunit S [Streptomyces sp. NPDC097640]|uniref:restriction endonuclease subunit S n=1 Tax=Streptomyces sp. NPDC097640 TaxID=3157229 RepID=UPI00331D5B1E